jgi:sugar phosphate isomerase/epimerase
MLEVTLPFTNYWHVKNYTRESTENGASTQPASLEDGVIDYAQALEMADGFGFEGVIVCEQYSDDWLEVLTENRLYLEQLLSEYDSSSRTGLTL